MQMLLNCHLAAFLEFEWTVQKGPTDNLITLACVIVLVYFS